MKKLLILGSTAVDVILKMDHLPTTSEDTNIISQKLSLGGCAFNVSDMARHFHIPYLLFSPIGTGIYGEFIKQEFHRRGLNLPPILPEEENGCCYCCVEGNGERTFLSNHGAEYRFHPEWFQLLNPSEYDSAYLCGLEVEEESGIHLIQFLEKHPMQSLFFAPGPRITTIQPDRMKRLLSLSPILHLNEDEALRFSGTTTIEQAANDISHTTHNAVIITIGKRGTYLYEPSISSGTYLPSTPVIPIDTIGAGDSHIGAVIACLKLGYSLKQACQIANQISAAVVLQEGSLLSDDQFERTLHGIKQLRTTNK